MASRSTCVSCRRDQQSLITYISTIKVFTSSKMCMYARTSGRPSSSACSVLPDPNAASTRKKLCGGKRCWKARAGSAPRCVGADGLI